jgi:hypothetical protein
MLFTTEQILQAKAPSIYAFLLKEGHKPEVDKSAYALFKSPFREDKTASLKVDKNENIFIDFGNTQHNGDFIAFYQLANNLNFKEAVTQILTNSFSFHSQQNYEVEEQKAQKMEIHKVKDLQNKALIEYLQSRKIYTNSFDHCKEVYYYANGKHYFAIGFENDSGGYELRNKYFKGCIGKKDITFVNALNGYKLAIFEGFFDFLAALSFWKSKGKFFDADCIILNSITQLPKCLPYLPDYEKVFTFFDNDTAGSQAFATLSQSYKVHSCSAMYAKHKDFSEFWEKTDFTSAYAY